MNSAGFYKLFNEEGNYMQGNVVVNINYAPNFVDAPTYKLAIERKNEPTYPVDGWYYFDSEELMMQFYGVTKIEL